MHFVGLLDLHPSKIATKGVGDRFRPHFNLSSLHKQSKVEIGGNFVSLYIYASDYRSNDSLSRVLILFDLASGS